MLILIRKNILDTELGSIEVVCIYYLMVVVLDCSFVVIFGIDMSSSVHVDNKGKEILILGKCPAQGLGEHSLTAEKMYSVSFTDLRKKMLFELAL